MSRLYFNRRIQMYLVFFILVSSVNVSANNLISSKESCNELMHFLIEEFSSAKNKSDEKYFTNHVLNDSIRVKYFLNQIKNLDPVVNFETHDSRNKYEVVLACLNSVDLIDKIIFNTEDPKLQLMAIDSIEHFKNTDSKELKQKLFDLYAKMNSNLSLENEVRKRAYENNRELSWGEKSLAGFVENSSRFNQLKSWKIDNENEEFAYEKRLIIESNTVKNQWGKNLSLKSYALKNGFKKMDIVNNQIGLLEGKKSNEYVEALITYSLPNIKNLEFNGAIVIQGDQSNKDMIILSEMGNLSLLELTKKGKLESVFLRPIQEVELSQSERKGLELLINQIGADEKTKVSLRAFFNSSYKQYYETLYMYIDDDFIVEALLKIKDEFLLKEKRDKVKINLLIIDLLNIFSSKMKYVDFDEDNTMEKISHSYDLLRDYVHRSDVTNDDKINLLRKYKESINKFLIDEDEKDELNRKISIEIDKIKKI